MTNINDCDVSCLFKDPFNLSQEIKICNLTLNGMGKRQYLDRFVQWNFQKQYSKFDRTLAVCVIETCYQIAKQMNQTYTVMSTPH